MGEAIEMAHTRGLIAGRVVPVAAYPALMALALAAMYVALLRGVEPILALGLIHGSAVVAVIALERVAPHIEAWNRDHGDLTCDALHGVVNVFLVPAALQAATFGALAVAGIWLEHRLDAALWPTTWPLGAQLILALVVTEFGQYWLHRLMHERPLLWRLHAVHHGAPRLYWLNAARVHPIDAALTYAVGLALLVFLGAPPDTRALYLVCAGVHASLQHSNIEMRLGVFNWIASQAELHRFHHAPDRVTSNHNYGAVLILWDVVFGTRIWPRDRASPVHPGIDDAPDFPRTYWAQLLFPVRRQR